VAPVAKWPRTRLNFSGGTTRVMYQEGWAKIKRGRALAGPPSPGGGHRTYCLARLSSRRPPPLAAIGVPRRARRLFNGLRARPGEARRGTRPRLGNRVPIRPAPTRRVYHSYVWRASRTAVIE